MNKIITRRQAFKVGGKVFAKALALTGAVAAAGPALAALDVPAPAKGRGILVYNWNKDEWIRLNLKPLLADLETIYPEKVVCVEAERLEIAARLRTIIGGAS